MSIETNSIFYYLDEDIDTTNQYINFDEGGGELSATLTGGSYTHTTLATVVKTALDAAGGQVYTVAFDRDTRKYTISATSNFSLLINTGSQIGSSPFTLLGFTGADLSGTNTYTSNTEAGSAYEPQFILQSFVDDDDNQDKIDATVNEASDGSVEVIAFGTRYIYQMNIKYATDRDVTASGWIKNNSSGVSDLRSFMQRIINKVPFEFIPDIATRATFDKVILESTPESRQGTGFRLKELSLNGGPTGFFESGVIRLRVVS